MRHDEAYPVVGEDDRTEEPEQVATGRNGQGDTDPSGSDVTTGLESGWTFVTGRTRTYKKGSLSTTGVTIGRGSSVIEWNQKLKVGSSIHSLV